LVSETQSLIRQNTDNHPPEHRVSSSRTHIVVTFEHRESSFETKRVLQNTESHFLERIELSLEHKVSSFPGTQKDILQNTESHSPEHRKSFSRTQKDILPNTERHSPEHRKSFSGTQNFIFFILGEHRKLSAGTGGRPWAQNGLAHVFKKQLNGVTYFLLYIKSWMVMW